MRRAKWFEILARLHAIHAVKNRWLIRLKVRIGCFEIQFLDPDIFIKYFVAFGL